jgi:lipoate-protein ligase A
VALSDNLPEIPFKQFQYIPFETLSGSRNMAIDYFLSENCRQDDLPVLRFYGWKPYCISLGFHQKWDLIDFDAIRRDGIEVVKRPTGGRAIFHAEELTYCIVSPGSALHHKDLYYFFHTVLADALRGMDYQVDLKTDNEKLGKITHQPNDFPCFTRSAQTEIQYNGKKLIGSAQKIYEGSILQHGSLLIGKNHQNLTRYLNVSTEEKKVIEKDIRDKTICLHEIKKEHISQEKIIKSILNQLELVRGISVNSRSLTYVEIQSAISIEKQFSKPS